MRNAPALYKIYTVFYLQVARSWLNIAAYEERSDVDYKKVQMSYVNAHNAAKKAANRKLQVPWKVEPGSLRKIIVKLNS